MSDYPTCERSFATLCVYLEVPVDEITEKLGIEPTSAKQRGEKLGPRSPPLRSTVWLLRSEKFVDSQDLEKHLDWIFTKLEAKADAFKELQERGANTNVFCYWESKYGNGGPSLSVATMKRAVALGLEIGLDIYFKDHDLYATIGEGLNALELAVFKKLLETEGVEATDAELAAIRIQERSYSGVGFFTELIKESAIRVYPPSTEGMRGEADAVIGSSPDVQVGFVFFVDDGYVTMIEGFTYEEPWPESTSEFKILDTQLEKT